MNILIGYQARIQTGAHIQTRTPLIKPVRKQFKFKVKLQTFFFLLNVVLLLDPNSTKRPSEILDKS